MTLRAKIYKKGTWIVELWVSGPSGVPVFFGHSNFLSWEQALHWAIWRLTPRELTADPVTPWQAGRG